MPKKGEKHSLQTIKKISDRRKGQPSSTKGIKKTRLQKEKISVGRKGLFQWINNKELSNLMLRDFAIANLCFEDELNKPAIILYSGVIEAALWYWLKKDGRTKFINLIQEAERKKLISDSNINRMRVLKDFRDYVHINRELKEDFPLTHEIAQLAQKTCESLTKELQKKEKIKSNIEENKVVPTNKKIIFYSQLEGEILEQLQKEIGGVLKSQIHFVYGLPEKPEFIYTPDGIIRKGEDLFFIEIKHIIDKNLSNNIIENGIQTLKMVLEKFQQSSAPRGKIMALLVIVSSHNLGSNYTLEGLNIEVRFIRV